ncbi:MAG: SPOR domain-containing protein [Bacteroidota bacterium]
MNKLLDVLVVVVIFIFATLLVMALMKAMKKPTPEKNEAMLESTVKMGDKGSDDTTGLVDDSESWEEEINYGDTTSFEADGYNPDDIENLDPEMASKLSEIGDDGLKMEKKKEESTEDAPDRLNVKPIGDEFFVIAGSFQEHSNADNLVKQLSGLGYPAEAIQFRNSKLKSVIVKRLDSREKASDLVAELNAKHKVSAYIVKRRDN